MVACDASLQTFAWEAESSWAENVGTFSKGVRLIEPIDPSGIKRVMLPPERVVSARNDGTPGPWDIQFSFSVWWTGRGSTSAGAVTLTDLYALIGQGIGGAAVAAASGTTLTGGTVNIPTTTSSGTFSAGGIAPIGTLTDGDGCGQAHAIATHVANDMTLLTNMIGAPVNGAILYAPDLAYTASSSCQLTGFRSRIETSDGQWYVHGCVITGMTITQTNPGETPRLTFTVVGSWAESVANSFPTASPSGPTAPKVVHNASGSCFFNTVGTATSAHISLRQLALNLTLGISLDKGGRGVNAAQVITGAARTQDTLTVSAMVDALGADATPLYGDEFITNPFKHMLITFGGGDGNGIAAYLRNLCYEGDQPIQTVLDGRNRIPLMFRAYNGDTTTNDLTRAMLVLAGW
jgi:hypothetical protein